MCDSDESLLVEHALHVFCAEKKKNYEHHLEQPKCSTSFHLVLQLLLHDDLKVETKASASFAAMANNKSCCVC